MKRDVSKRSEKRLSEEGYGEVKKRLSEEGYGEVKNVCVRNATAK